MMNVFVRVKTNARKNEVCCIDKTHYVVSTTTIPEKGKANQEVVKLLADFLRIGKQKLQIIKGAKSCNKIITILD